MIYITLLVSVEIHLYVVLATNLLFGERAEESKTSIQIEILSGRARIHEGLRPRIKLGIVLSNGLDNQSPI